METRAPSLRLIALPVVFVAACVLLTLATYWAFGGSFPLQPKGYRVTVPLSASSNLVTGSDVQIAGVPIGEVADVRRAGNGAEAEVEIHDDFAPLREGTTALARTKTLLGEGYIEITLGPASAARIPDRGRISAKQVRRNVQLDEFLETFDAPTRDRMHDVFTGLAGAVDGRGQNINDTLGSAAGTTAGLEQILSVVDGQRADLGQLISGSADVLQAVGDQAGLVRRSVRAGRAVLDTTAARERDLRATVRALPPFLRDLDGAARAVTAAAPELNRAVTSLEPVAGKAPGSLRTIRRSAPDFERLFKGLPGVVISGKRGLPALSAILRPARRALAEFYPASREVIPLVQLIAANPSGPVGAFANVANLTNGIFVGPGGLIQHYATGLPTVWNETIGGWKKRLPSNIQNPYLKPGGLEDIVDFGTVKAFDCRNADNVNYLPPLGTAPPCLLQGPWEYQGKSAFYPQLELAPK